VKVKAAVRSSLLAAAALLPALSPGARGEEEAARLRWDREGIAALPAAAAAARGSGSRLLLGLSGSPT
jgi:hypothetical protein